VHHVPGALLQSPARRLAALPPALALALRELRLLPPPRLQPRLLGSQVRAPLTPQRA